MLRCSEFVEAVTEVEEGAASLPLRFRFRLHRIECANCRRFLRQLRAVRGAMGREEQRGEK